MQATRGSNAICLCPVRGVDTTLAHLPLRFDARDGAAMPVSLAEAVFVFTLAHTLS